MDIIAGTHLNDASEEAITIAYLLKQLVAFKFNGIHLKVRPNSNLVDIIQQYDTAIEESIQYKRDILTELGWRHRNNG